MNNTQTEPKVWADKKSVENLPYSNESQNAFNKKYGSQYRNFLTPVVEKYIETEKYYVEISRGLDSENDKVYATTFLTKDLIEDLQLSRSGFSGLNNAINHIVKAINEQ